MTSLIGHVEEFDVGQPSTWDAYAERLEFYFEANEIKTDIQKKAVLFSVCGARTYAIIRSLISPACPKDKTFKEIVAITKSHFAPNPSEIYQRFKFHRRNQHMNEGIATYIAELRRLAEHCKFDSSLESTLRDRLVCGIRDEALQRRLLAENTLTFAQAQEKALAAEAASSHAKEIQGHESLHPITEFQKTPPHDIRKSNRLYPNRLYPKQSNKSEKTVFPISCASCGGNHTRTQCRFKDAECRFCKKTGHIERVCRSKQQGVPTKAYQVEPDIDHEVEDAYQMRYIHEQCNNAINFIGDDSINVTVTINGLPCEMEVDSGAKTTIIDEATFNRLYPKSKPGICRPPYMLKDYNQQTVKTVGLCQVQVSYGSFAGKLPLVVAKGQRPSLLGRSWFQPLGISVNGLHQVTTVMINEVLEKFKDVFSEELGTFKGMPVSFHIDPSVAPVQLKARNVPFALRPKIEKELKRLQEQGVLEPVTYTTWATPIVPVLKQNGDVRICGDYKSTLNRALSQDPYPIPAISQLLAELSGGRFFAKLDLSQAYLQLTVDESAAMAQTIVTHKGAFKCNRLQFGIKTAPGIFQRFIETLLAGIPGVIPYFDDVIIRGATEQELSSSLHEVLSRFAKSGIKAKREKCIFGASNVIFLGFHIDRNGIRPTDDKVKAIHQAPTPKNKEELQAFLGLLNFYHVFIRDKATIAEPLHRLLDKRATWTWSEVHNNAFVTVKRLLSANTLLTHFDEKKPIILTCDASPYGVGAVLGHQLEPGIEAPIAYYSRTMNTTERRYAQIDREALAIIQGVKKFHNYLYGHQFEIRTDHKPLLGLLSKGKPTPSMLTPRMQRWSLMLSSYDYNLVYCPGKSIGNADGLSRLPLPSTEANIPPPMEVLLLEALEKPPLHAVDISRMTEEDPLLRRVLNLVRKGWPSSGLGKDFEPFSRRQKELSVHRNCILWGCRVVIPSSARQHILKTLHVSHQGIVLTKALARSYVWWPGIDNDIETMVKCCDICQQTRHAPPKAPFIPWEKAREPWSRLHIDHAGPFQNATFLIVVDSFSKWLEVVKVNSTSAKTTIDRLRGLFATHGLPSTIVSDNATGFTSTEFQSFLERNGIRHVKTAPYHPSSNGQAERMVQTVKNALRRIVTGDWSLRLAGFLLSQHVTPNAITGISPAELLMGRRLKTCLDRLHPDFAEAMTKNNEKGQNKIRGSGRLRSFAPLDPVYAKGFGSQPCWVPATIINIKGATSYEVETEDGQLWNRHIDQLRSRHPDAEGAIPAGSFDDGFPFSSTPCLGPVILPEESAQQDLPAPPEIPQTAQE